MEVKTSQSYQKEVLEKYKREKGGEMSSYLVNPTRKNIREACLWLLDRRKGKNDEYILNRFFQFKLGEDKARYIQGLKSEKADKFVPLIQFLNEKTSSTSSENLDLISWLIDFQPRPLQDYLNKNDFHIEEGVPQIKTSDINGGKNYGDNKAKGTTRKLNEEGKETDKGTNGITVEPRRKWITISISVALGAALLILGVQKWSINRQGNNSVVDKCMTWADSLYIPISCDKSPLSKYGTQVKPLDKMELKNMRKVEVNAAYQFFSADGKPLVWYFKNKNNEHEFFTASGHHPVNNETLRKITPYIIQKYVPVHVKKKSSFVQ